MLDNFKMQLISTEKIFFLLIILLMFFILRDSIFSYFSQDDFFHLRSIMYKNLNDIPFFFFSLQKEYAFFRPLSRETFNLVMYKSFGLNPLPFHLVNYFLIACNVLLVFILARIISKNSVFSYLSAVIYAANTIHSVELYYLASVQTLLAAYFLIVSIIFYVKFLTNHNLKKYLLSITFFILALFSHEMSLVLPGIIMLLEFFQIREKFSLKVLKSFTLRLLPFAAIGLLYLSFTSLFAHLPSEQVYQPIFSPKSILNSLFWYTIWSFGLSEIFIDFIGPHLAINPNLLKWYGSYLKFVLPLSGCILLIVLGVVFRFKKELIKSRIILFSLSSYVVALSPFLLFPQHKSTFYLSFSMIWFSCFLAYPLFFLWNFKKFGRVLAILVIAAFILVSYQTTQLNKLTYWAAKRAAAAKYLISDFKENYPMLSKGSIIYIKNDSTYPVIAKEWGTSSKQAFYILSGSDAFKLFYNDPKIQVFFEGINELPKDTDQTKVIFYTASFPY